MKKLSSLLLSGMLLFGGNAVAQENENQKNIFVKLGVPEKFLDYEKMGIADNNFDSYGSETFHFEDYTDWKILVREVRKVNQIFETVSEEYPKTLVSDEKIPGEITEDKYPSIIIFDLNGNFIYEEDETLIDESADGINGNEVWLRDLKTKSKWRL